MGLSSDGKTEIPGESEDTRGARAEVGNNDAIGNRARGWHQLSCDTPLCIRMRSWKDVEKVKVALSDDEAKYSS